MSAECRSREVHAEREWRRDKGLERYLGVARAARRLPGLSECVCEEPCRYCRCETSC